MSQVASIHRRDRGRCHLCRHTVARGEASRDHLRARSLGGYDKSRNYKNAHRTCNSARGALPLERAYACIKALGENPGRQQVIDALRAECKAWMREGGGAAIEAHRAQRVAPMPPPRKRRRR